MVTRADPMVPIYVVLLHHPVTNRRGELVTTAVTNLDIHDIARSARTYECRGYFIVTPIEDQHTMIDRILHHWQTGASREYHPDRFEALSLVRLVKDFSEVRSAIAAETHQTGLEVIMPDARPLPEQVTYENLRKKLESGEINKPAALVFGTGWGVSDSFYPEVNRFLAPVYGPEGGSERGYNHLSVRAAVAIVLDRLFGK